MLCQCQSISGRQVSILANVTYSRECRGRPRGCSPNKKITPPPKENCVWLRDWRSWHKTDLEVLNWRRPVTVAAAAVHLQYHASVGLHQLVGAHALHLTTYVVTQLHVSGGPSWQIIHLLIAVRHHVHRHRYHICSRALIAMIFINRLIMKFGD